MAYFSTAPSRLQVLTRLLTAISLFATTFTSLAASDALPLTPEERTWLDQHPQIEIGIMEAWPPMDYVNESGVPEGIGVEIIHLLNRSLDNRLVIKPGPWKETYTAVKEQRMAALMDITPKESRKPFFNFTPPYISVPHNIFTRKEDSKRNALSDLAGQRVGIERGFFLVNVFKEKYPAVTVTEFNNTSDALDALAKGQIDAYVGNRAVAAHIINSELIPNLIIQGKIHETSSVNAIGIRKDWPLLHSILSKALAAIPQSDHKRIHQQWVGAIEQEFDYKTLFNILIPVVLLLLFLVIWNRNLQWMVKRRTAELEQAKNEAITANLAKDDFLASMSHELRTPLTAIIGYSDLLCQQESNHEKKQLIHSIELASRTQLFLVNDILDISKIESGKFTIQDHPYDLTQTIDEIKQIFTKRAENEGMQLSVSPTPQIETYLLGDEQRIKQILINLLDNALKFRKEGGDNLIQLTTEITDQQLCFTVEDHGIGMNDETKSKILQRFHQADNSISRRFGGSGLGLYITQSLVTLMEGDIEISSQPNIGSTFKIILPYRPGEPLQRDKATAHDTASSADKQVEPGNILLVEDTVLLQQLERRILEGMGHTVTLAENGKEACEMAAENHYDLILMDMQMPVMDGIAATQAIRDSGNPVPIVALTANVMQKHRELFKQAGCDDFLAKPIENEALSQAINHFLSQQERAETTPPPPSHAQQQSNVMNNDELAELFLTRTKILRDDMISALSKQDWALVYDQAHALKGSGTPYGYPEISRLGTLVCDAIDTEQYKDAEREAEALAAEVDRIQANAQSDNGEQQNLI